MTNSSTRIPRCEVMGLCEAIFAENPGLPVFGARVLGLFLCVRLTLILAAAQPAPGAARRALRRLPGHRLPRHQHLHAPDRRDQVPVVEDLDPTAQLIIDGTLLQCWSWKDHSELYSGKHKTTGLNVQVACTLSGTLAWISDPQDGCTHDAQERPARRPRHRPARRGVTTQAYWRQGVHRTGHDHPKKKTRKTSPPPRRQGLQPGRQPDPLQDRIGARQTSLEFSSLRW